MPVSKKVAPIMCCIFINTKRDKNLQSSPGDLKYPDLGTNLQGPWESSHQSALSYSDLRACDLLVIQISREEVVMASLSLGSPSSDFPPWLWPLPMTWLHPIYCPCFPIVNWSWPPTNSSFPYVLQGHRNLLSWWHTSDNIFFNKNNTEL